MEPLDGSKETRAQHTAHSTATISIKKDHLFVLLAVGFLVIGFAGGYFVNDFTGGGTTTQNTTNPNPTQPTQPQQPPSPEEITFAIEADDPVMGDANAPLTIVEFSDPSCPFCGGAAGLNEQVVQYLQGKDSTWQAPEPGIIENYVKTGKARLVFKYFPGHGTGAEAMKLALCANEQGKFWEAHDIFFSNQDKMENITALEDLMSGIDSIDAAKLIECYDSDKYADKLTADTSEGQAAGMQGTPTFFIGNEEDGYVKVTGAQSFTTIKTTIDAALA